MEIKYLDQICENFPRLVDLKSKKVTKADSVIRIDKYIFIKLNEYEWTVSTLQKTEGWAYPFNFNWSWQKEILTALLKLKLISQNRFETLTKQGNEKYEREVTKREVDYLKSMAERLGYTITPNN